MEDNWKGEIIPDFLYIGDRLTAGDSDRLKVLGITHVVTQPVLARPRVLHLGFSSFYLPFFSRCVFSTLLLACFLSRVLFLVPPPPPRPLPEKQPFPTYPCYIYTPRGVAQDLGVSVPSWDGQARLEWVNV